MHSNADGLSRRPCPQCGRLQDILTTMLTTMLDPERNQKDWDERVPYAMLAYRSAVQESTGESPSMMMLGREITLPVDISISRPSVPSVSRHPEYLEVTVRVDRLPPGTESRVIKVEVYTETYARVNGSPRLIRSWLQPYTNTLSQ